MFDFRHQRLVLCLLLAVTAPVSGQTTMPPPEPLVPEKSRRSPALEAPTTEALKPYSLDELLLNTTWELKAADCEKIFGSGWKWLSPAKDRAMYSLKPKAGRPARIQLLGQGIHDGLIDFTGGKADQMVFWLYLRGRDGEVKPEDFEKRFESLKNLLIAKQGKPIKEKVASTLVQTRNLIWKFPQAEVMLVSSMGTADGKPRAEFLRLHLAKPGRLSAQGHPTKLDVKAFAKRVARDAKTGEVVLTGVPMVDQGEKGWCVQATSQRLFEYLGIKIDQYEMAQITSASSRGTRLEVMEESLEQMRSRLHVGFKAILPPLSSEREHDRILKEYNRIAKKLGKKEADYKRMQYQLSGLDPNVLREARSANGAGEALFQKVKASIDRGLPLLWVLELGIYPEEGTNPRQKSQAHMRLIVGYNESTKHLLFSDSWGLGHEKKRIDYRDALAATLALYAVELRD